MKRNKEKKSFFKLSKISISLRSMSDRSRIIWLFVIAIILSAFWWFFMMQPYRTERAKYTVRIKAIEQQIKVLKDQSRVLVDRYENKTSGANIQQHALHQDVRKLNENLSIFESDIVNPAKLVTILRDFLNQEAGISLVSLKTMPPISLTGTSSKNQMLDENNMELTFHGNYFSALSYLEKLQQLKTKIFWTDFEYQVLDYPDASTILHFHVLSIKEGQ